MAAKSYTVLAEVQSKSTGDTYQIRRGGDDVTYCNCKGWIFSKSVPKSCKHLRAYLADVQANPNGQQVVANAAYVGVPQQPWAQYQQAAAVVMPKAAKPTGLAAVLLDMAKKMERGEQYATSVIVAKMREAANAIQAAMPTVPAAVTAFQPVLGAVRIIMLDD
jgi:hypothetical protein